jgi:hypothetical protein
MLRDGSPGARPNPLRLQAGQFTMSFEPDTAFLRYLRVGDHEIVRAIYGAVRDQNWSTITPKLSNLESNSAKDSFQLTFDAECREREIDFFWKGTITGDAQGRITFAFDGEARSSFLRNRIGICVLHPIVECAGKPCTVEKADGTAEEGTFPRFISPHQPFKQIRAITYDAAPGVRAEVRFQGDTFEMEDQRNWTDASFKTYSTPLELPMPVRVEKGARIQQSVSISLMGDARKVLPVLQGRAPQFSISTTPVLPKPALGLKIASHGQALSAKEVERLKRLRLAHLRLDLKLSDPHYRDVLRQGSQEASQLGVSLQIALFLTDNADKELTGLVEELTALNSKVSLWMIFHHNEEVTSEKWLQLARERLSACSSNILVAAGTAANFVELNRCRPATDSRALPCYSINPQIHAFDNTTLIDNLGAQVGTVETTQQFCSQSVVISPITLRPQADPGAFVALGTLPPSVDPRQMSLFGAGWTLGSIARLSNTSNIHSLTYFETTGWLGVMDTEKGSSAPDKFPSLPNAVFPVYHVFADIAEYGRVCPTHSSHPLQVEGLTLLDTQNRRRILVANLLSEPQDVKIKTGTCQARIRYLDETNAGQAMNAPEAFRSQPGELAESVSGKIELKLLPFALACVDIV